MHEGEVKVIKVPTTVRESGRVVPISFASPPPHIKMEASPASRAEDSARHEQFPFFMNEAGVDFVPRNVADARPRPPAMEEEDAGRLAGKARQVRTL